MPYASILPTLTAWRAKDRWAHWPPTMWRLHRTWSVVRLTGTLGILSADGAKLLPVIPQCVWCGAHAVGILHIIAECPRTADLRAPWPELDSQTLLKHAIASHTPTEQDAFHKVRLVGGSISRLAEELHLDVAS